MDQLIKELKELYPDTCFKASYRDGRKVLIYDNEDLEWDEQFISNVLKSAKKYLKEDELDNFSFLYDYLGELISHKIENEQTFFLNYTKEINTNIKLHKEFKFGSIKFNIQVENVSESDCQDEIEFKDNILIMDSSV